MARKHRHFHLSEAARKRISAAMHRRHHAKRHTLEHHKRARRHLSAEARAKLRARLKAYWAKRKKEGLGFKHHSAKKRHHLSTWKLHGVHHAKHPMSYARNTSGVKGRFHGAPHRFYGQHRIGTRSFGAPRVMNHTPHGQIVSSIHPRGVTKSGMRSRSASIIHSRRVHVQQIVRPKKRRGLGKLP